MRHGKPDAKSNRADDFVRVDHALAIRVPNRDQAVKPKSFRENRFSERLINQIEPAGG